MDVGYEGIASSIFAWLLSFVRQLTQSVGTRRALMFEFSVRQNAVRPEWHSSLALSRFNDKTNFA